MKKTMISAALAGLAILGAAAPALAQPYHPAGPAAAAAPSCWDLDRRIDWLQQRIDRGQRDGSLDRGEYLRVQRELRHIQRDEGRMRHRDGHIDRYERGELVARLYHLSDQIRWLRHNYERRPW